MTVEFGPGVTRRIVRLPLVDDAVTEPTETVDLDLSIGAGSAVGAAVTAGAVHATAEILDGDLPAGPTRLAITLLPNGRLRIEAFGPVGRAHVLERATELLLPWTPVAGAGQIISAGMTVPVAFELPSEGIDSVLFRLSRP